MPDTPFKIRIRRVRGDVVVDYLVQLGRSGYKVVESVNLGEVSFREAIGSLDLVDPLLAPRLRAAVVPEIT